MALKAKLFEETQNSMFQRHTTASYDGHKTDKIDSNYQILQNITSKYMII